MWRKKWYRRRNLGETAADSVSSPSVHARACSHWPSVSFQLPFQQVGGRHGCCCSTASSLRSFLQSPETLQKFQNKQFIFIGKSTKKRENFRYKPKHSCHIVDRIQLVNKDYRPSSFSHYSSSSTWPQVDEGDHWPASNLYFRFKSKSITKLGQRSGGQCCYFSTKPHCSSYILLPAARMH